jgi:hypothetical protein
VKAPPKDPAPGPAGDDGLVPATPAALLTRLEAEGPIRVGHPAEDVRARWRRLLYAAVNGSTIPAGMALRHTGRDRGDLVVWLEPAVAEPSGEAATEVPMPDRVRNPHPFIGALRSAKADSDGWIDTTRESDIARVRIHRTSRDRAVRILHAIALEALRRGHGLTAPTRDVQGLRILVGSFAAELVVIEETDREPHTPTKAELSQAARSPWFRVPEWDRVPSGRLVLRDRVGSYSTTLASDRKRWKLEDRLNKVFDTIEEYARQAEERRLEAEAQELERRRLWKTAMANARVAFVEHRRREHLLAQLEDWELAERLERFIAAVDAAGGRRAETTEWIEWGKGHARRLDPVRRGVSGPEISEPNPGDLQPFMGGLSPYGPDSRHR